MTPGTEALPETYSHVKDLIKNSQHIVITTHTGPDADGIGSQSSLCMALKCLGKNAQCVNELPLLERYHYLDPQNLIIGHQDFQAPDKIDLFIVVDTNNSKRIGDNMAKVLSRSANVLFIDHHPCSDEIMKLHCIDTSAAATGQVIGEIIQELGVEFTQDMALPIYTAILIDTSSFRYPTVTDRTHLLISKLLKTGIKPPDAFNLINGAKKIEHMRFLGKVLSEAETNQTQEIAWIKLSDEMMEDFNSDIEDTHAFINHLLVLENIKVACMFRAIGEKVRISFRSAGDIDVGQIAQALGGGGHNHSAATVVVGDLSQVIQSTVSKIERIFSTQ